MAHDVKKILEKGLRFIASEQTGDGGFLSLSSLSKKDFRHAKTYRTVFAPSLILSCLSILKDCPEAKAVKKKIKTFLLSQKNERWAFNYLARDSEEARIFVYPDDLDTTFCSLSALHSHNPRIITAEALMKIAAILSFTEENKAGPYRTWIVSSDWPRGWLDVDVAVNANVAYFLSLVKIDLPGLRSFIETAIDSQNYFSRYYPSEYPIIYFIARYYRGEKKGELGGFILRKQRRDGGWGNPLYTALAISSLIRLGLEPAKLRRSIDCLLAARNNGVWGPEAFCMDPPLAGKIRYYVSGALTTAFCLEALALYFKKNCISSGISA